VAGSLVHLASVYLPAQALRDRRFRAVLYLGAILPDLLKAGVTYLLGASRAVADATHAPLVLLAVAYAGALLFEEAWRTRAFGALLLGAGAHVLIDGAGGAGWGILWAFPLSMGRAELGGWGPEAAAPLELGAGGLLLLWELGRRAFRRSPPRPQIPRRSTAS
jgi:hypothetical protein